MPGVVGHISDSPQAPPRSRDSYSNRVCATPSENETTRLEPIRIVLQTVSEQWFRHSSAGFTATEILATGWTRVQLSGSREALQ